MKKKGTGSVGIWARSEEAAKMSVASNASRLGGIGNIKFGTIDNIIGVKLVREKDRAVENDAGKVIGHLNYYEVEVEGEARKNA